jgi:tRNA threonylcarbamoyladenosine biosynthesis protein TsaE
MTGPPRADAATERISRSPQATEDLGAELGGRLGAHDVVYIVGALGAGKTCFARGLARGAGAAAAQVASPTFAIVNEYAGSDGVIRLRHLDLYRIADRERDLAQIGVPDALEGAPVCVEWPGEAIRRLLPPTVEIEIELVGETERRIRVTN